MTRNGILGACAALVLGAAGCAGGAAYEDADGRVVIVDDAEGSTAAALVAAGATRGADGSVTVPLATTGSGASGSSSSSVASATASGPTTYVVVVRQAPVPTGGNLPNGGSSPDPIPARPTDDPRPTASTDCSTYSDPVKREACDRAAGRRP